MARSLSSGSRWRWAWRCAWPCSRRWRGICPMRDTSPLGAAMPAQPLLFLDALLVDPATGRETRGDCLVEDGVIQALGPGLSAHAPAGVRLIACEGRVLAPGLIDMRAFVG